mmetsp:Transcript_912/g.1588  ORF Transcript_912/g.1588 Transcript_912/m.1588 type:complete len:396 (-) Transcript_912:17-1204(-)
MLRAIEPQAAQHCLHIQEKLGEDLLDAHGLVHCAVTVVHGHVVLVQQEQEADLAGGVGLQRVLDRDEVLQRLGHLEALDVEVSGVQPVVHPLLAVAATLALRDFVLMVGKLQVHAASVYVHSVRAVGVESALGHDGALNVPSGPAASPRRLPRGLYRAVRVLLGLLPQHEVRRVLLVVIGGKCTLSLSQQLRVSNLLWHQLAILVATLFEGSGVEVHGAVGRVCVTLLAEVFDVCDDLRDVLAHAGHQIGQAHPQLAHVVEEVRLIGRGQLSEVDALLRAADNDLIIDVGDVLAHHHIVAQVILGDAADDVELHIGASVAHVRGSIDSGSALVPQHSFGALGNETNLGAGEGVRHLQGVHSVHDVSATVERLRHLPGMHVGVSVVAHCRRCIKAI